MAEVSSIPFNRPFATGQEASYIEEAIARGHLSGHGPFAGRCEGVLRELSDSAAALLTPSCSAALEMAVLLARIGPGDEVIMPSFTFVATANAVALRGGIPVFVDIRPDTLNIDERGIEDAITPRTRAVIVVHYGGVGAAMDVILRVARRHGLLVIEDAAHAIHASLGDRELGAYGDLATFSFHETKNVQCGEGGALIVRDPGTVERAEIVQDKGTNRRRFLRGQVDKYTWVDLGSSYLASEISAAFLFAQLAQRSEITQRRLSVWHAYDEAFRPAEKEYGIRCPIVPSECRHNGHLYYLLMPSEAARDAFIESMARLRIQTVFHYLPLHLAPAARSLARARGSLPVTEQVSGRLVRLPIWPAMTNDEVERVIEATLATIREDAGRAGRAWSLT